MSKHTNIHDSFFKDVLSDRQAAGIFLREHLPREVADLLTPDLPELLPGSFVDELLGQILRSDLPERLDVVLANMAQLSRSPHSRSVSKTCASPSR